MSAVSGLSVNRGVWGTIVYNSLFLHDPPPVASEAANAKAAASLRAIVESMSRVELGLPEPTGLKASSTSRHIVPQSNRLEAPPSQPPPAHEFDEDLPF